MPLLNAIRQQGEAYKAKKSTAICNIYMPVSSRKLFV